MVSWYWLYSLILCEVSGTYFYTYMCQLKVVTGLLWGISIFALSQHALSINFHSDVIMHYWGDADCTAVCRLYKYREL